MGLAMPSYRYVTNSNRIAGEINGLLGDLQFARAEAIKEGFERHRLRVPKRHQLQRRDFMGKRLDRVLRSEQHGRRWCGNGPLRVQSPFSGSDTFGASNGVNRITFNREGYAAGIPNGTLISLHDSTANTAWTRCLSVNLSGLLVSEKFGQTVNGVTCN